MTFTEKNTKLPDLRLYLVTDYGLATALNRSELEIVRAAIAGGVTAVQFRDKSRSSRELYQVGRQLRELCAEFGVSFIVNDRLDLALALEADGLHLGQSDLPIEAARQIAGERLFIGISVVNEAETRAAVATGADYLGASPVFTSSTKPDAGEGMGLSRLAEVVEVARSVPVVGIGSINSSNAEGVMAAGAAGVAVVSAIVTAPDIEVAARQLRSQVDKYIKS